MDLNEIIKKDVKFTIHSIFSEDSKSQPLQFNNNYIKKWIGWSWDLSLSSNLFFSCECLCYGPSLKYGENWMCSVRHMRTRSQWKANASVSLPIESRQLQYVWIMTIQPPNYYNHYEVKWQPTLSKQPHSGLSL